MTTQDKPQPSASQFRIVTERKNGNNESVDFDFEIGGGPLQYSQARADLIRHVAQMPPQADFMSAFHRAAPLLCQAANGKSGASHSTRTLVTLEDFG